jgi:hypothetical protein
MIIVIGFNKGLNGRSGRQREGEGRRRIERMKDLQESANITS